MGKLWEQEVKKYYRRAYSDDLADTAPRKWQTWVVRPGSDASKKWQRWVQLCQVGQSYFHVIKLCYLALFCQLCGDILCILTVSSAAKAK